MNENRKHQFHIALIIILAVIAYANTFGNEFVWDDKSLILSNGYIKDLRNIPLFFTNDFWMLSGEHYKSGYYRPLALLSFAIDFRIWGLNPFGYHLTNLFFHVLNSLLIFFIAERITKKRDMALLASLFFTVHPVHTESITFIGSRNDAMSAFFFLLAFLLYISSNYFVSSISLLLALLSKETALVLPVLIITYDCLIEGKSIQELKGKTKLYSIYFAIIALYLFFRFFILGIISPVRPYHGGSFYYTLLTMSKVFVKYVQITLIPVNMAVEPYISISKSIFEPAVLLSILLLSTVLAMAIVAYKQDKVASFSIAWFFVTLLPGSNIIPTQILMAERYLYLPSFGFCLLLALIFDKLHNRFPNKRVIILLFFASMLVSYTGATINRNFDYKDDITLWSRTIEISPYSPKTHLNMGLAYYERGLFDLAIPEYKRAIELDPNYAQAYINLGTAYALLGKNDLAIPAVQKAIELDPHNPSSHKGLGLIYYINGSYDLSIEEFRKSLFFDASDVETIKFLANSHNELGITYINKTDYDLAIAEFEKAIQIEPEFAEAHSNLGRVYALMGRFDLARQEFRRAIEIDPSNKIYQSNLETLDMVE